MNLWECLEEAQTYTAFRLSALYPNLGMISPWGLPGSEDFPHRGNSLANTGQIPANQVFFFFFSLLWPEELFPTNILLI